MHQAVLRYLQANVIANHGWGLGVRFKVAGLGLSVMLGAAIYLKPTAILRLEACTWRPKQAEQDWQRFTCQLDVRYCNSES